MEKKSKRTGPRKMTEQDYVDEYNDCVNGHAHIWFVHFKLAGWSGCGLSGGSQTVVRKRVTCPGCLKLLRSRKGRRA